MPDDKKHARGWWVPSKRVPVRILDAMVLVGALAAGVLLILTIVGFSMASSRGAALEAALGQLRKTEVDKRTGGAQLDTLKAEAETLKRERDATLASVESLEGRLARMKISLDALTTKYGALKDLLETTDEAKQKFFGKMEGLHENLKQEKVGRYEAEQKNRRLGEELKAAQAVIHGVQKTMKEMKATLAVFAEKEADWAEKAKSYEAGLAEARDEVAKRAKRIENLDREFGDIPIIPLTEDLAGMKWEDIQKDVASHEGREDRIDMLFRAKLVLAGTRYESLADRSWKREQAQRQAHLDREATVVYGEVTGRIRATPDAHAENLRLLSEALRKVKGSRYEERIIKFIAKEKVFVGDE